MFAQLLSLSGEMRKKGVLRLCGPAESHRPFRKSDGKALCEPMTRILIIAIGNPLRGDDGLAWRAAAMLQGEGEVPGERAPHPPFETIVCHQLTPELAENVAQADRVIFIDACLGSQPGKIRVNRLAPEPSQASALSHRLDPPALMQHCSEIYGTWPEAWTISMTGADYDYSQSLSAAVESQLPALVDMAIQTILKRLAHSQETIEVPSNG